MIRQAEGLCVICGEGPLERCLCVRKLRKEQAEKERRAAEREARRTLLEQCRAHNERAANRAALAVEAVSGAIGRSRGKLSEARRELGIDKFSDADIVLYERHAWATPHLQDTEPCHAYLRSWMKKHAPELLERARHLRQAGKG